MPIYFFPILFLMVTLVSLYDLKYHKVPNWITLPLILIGFAFGFPGSPVLWIGSIFIFQAWMIGLIGRRRETLGGIVVVLIHLAGEKMLLVMSISLMVTRLAQILVRAITKKKIETGIKTLAHGGR
jgi:Flp pilus assembly protein protease CpaA